MVYPTRSIVAELNFDKMTTLAEELNDYAERTASDAQTTRDTITRLDWSGGAKNAAESRAHREHAQLMRVSATFTSLANAITTGHTNLSSLAGDLKLTATAYEANDYSVADNWKVTDSYNYALAESAAAGDDEQLTALETLKATRARIAENATLWMERVARDFDTADTDTAAAIRGANGVLDELTPPAAGLSSGGAAKILDNWDDGRGLTREQMYALAAAGNLTPEQLQALHAGQPVNIPQGQYDFLRTLFRGMDGMSVEEITGLPGTGEQSAAVRNLLANGMQIMSNPSVSTDAGDAGGMAVLPTNVRTLLTEKPAQTAPSAHGSAVRRLGEFDALADLLLAGDDSLRMGTDIDRAFLKQAAEITASLEGDPTRRAFGDVIMTPEETSRFLDKMIGVASPDKAAIHDFVTGSNMDVTCSDGGKFNADSHLDALFGHKWDEIATNVNNLFKWVGSDAGNPQNSYYAGTAADTATALGKYLGAESNMSIGGNLGVNSPHLAQTLAGALAPYLGDYAHSFTGSTGIPTYGAGELTAGELKNVFRALDSDPAAAAIINQAGAQWQLAMAYQAGAHDLPQLGVAAGLLADAMRDGMDEEIAHLSETAYKDRVGDYQDKLNAATMLRYVASVSTYGAALNALVPPEVEQRLFGGPPDLDSMTAEERARYASVNVPALTDPQAIRFAYFVGAASTDPSLQDQFPGGFDEKGRPNYEQLIEWDKANGGKWTKWMSEQMSQGFDSNFDLGVGAPDQPGPPPQAGTLPLVPGGKPVG